MSSTGTIMTIDPQGRSPAEVARDRKCSQMIRKVWQLQMLRAGPDATADEYYQAGIDLSPAREMIYRLYGAP